MSYLVLNLNILEQLFSNTKEIAIFYDLMLCVCVMRECPFDVYLRMNVKVTRFSYFVVLVATIMYSSTFLSRKHVSVISKTNRVTFA